MQPLDDYYLWCDHRAHEEARQITQLALAENLEAIHWCGDVYSHEWGFAKLLHWLRHNPEKRERFATALEHCDMVAATLAGGDRSGEGEAQHLRDGPQVDVEPEVGWVAARNRVYCPRVDPLFDGVREKIGGEYLASDSIAGTLSAGWAAMMGLRAGIPLPVGAFDAHWTRLARAVAREMWSNVVGTSDVHHCDGEEDGACAWSVRRSAGQRASWPIPGLKRGFRLREISLRRSLVALA